MDFDLVVTKSTVDFKHKFLDGANADDSGIDSNADTADLIVTDHNIAHNNGVSQE